IECDVGGEVGGVVAVDAVALEEAPVFAGALGGRTRPVLGPEPNANSGYAENGGACCNSHARTPSTRPRVPPTPSEAVPLDSSATRSCVGPKMQPEPSKSQFQEEFRVPEPVVELF